MTPQSAALAAPLDKGSYGRSVIRPAALRADPSSAARQLPLQGSLWGCVSGRCRNHPALAARGRARPPAQGTRREKCIAETYETQPPPRRQSNAGPKAGEDGYHFGRARELVRPATTTLPDLPTAARKSRGGSITQVARAVSARFAQPPISPQGGPAPQTTPTDRPPKGVFPFGESEGRFLLSPQKKAPLRKRLYYG